MVRVLINKHEVLVAYTTSNDYADLQHEIQEKTQLNLHEFYLEQNGKRLSVDHSIDASHDVHCILRVCGGKGGFGSMLRAIGAQIEKTTNREACRDLSGRRLRDINEEKRLRAWLDKEGERKREAEERKKRKIQKLLAVPKHEFKDEKYEEARSKVTESVNDAFEKGLKKELEAKKGATSSEQAESKGAIKRKNADDKECADAKKKKIVKGGLWLGDDLSDTDDSEDDSDVGNNSGSEKSKSVVKL